MCPLECVVRGDEEEDNMQALLTCTGNLAEQVWRDAQLWDAIEQTSGHNGNMADNVFSLL